MTLAARNGPERARFERITAELESAGSGQFALDHDVHVALDLARDSLNGLKRTDLPEVTTSIEAALALAERVLPKDFSVVIGRRAWWDFKGQQSAHVYDGCRTFEPVVAATVPLALCIAIIRARERLA